MTRKMSAKGAKAKADKMFSLIVRSRGACESCGSTSNLQCAHIMSRRFNNTRCDETNAFCLCAGCHLYFTDHPIEFTRFVFRTKGEPEYDRLFTLAHASTLRLSWPDVAAALSVRWAEIESGVAS